MTKPFVRRVDSHAGRGLYCSGFSGQVSAEPLRPDSSLPGESHPEPWDSGLRRCCVRAAAIRPNDAGSRAPVSAPRQIMPASYDFVVPANSYDTTSLGGSVPVATILVTLRWSTTSGDLSATRQALAALASRQPAGPVTATGVR